MPPVDFKKFCKLLEVEEPTQGLGYAYNYAKVVSEALNESLGEEPPQCTLRGGACTVSLHTDMIGFNRTQTSQLASALQTAESFSLRKAGDEFYMEAVFRV